MPSHPTLLAVLLERQSLAASARGRQRGDAALLERVLHLVPQSLRLHCVSVSRSDRTLKLVVSSPVWATRARYCEAELLAGLRDCEVERVVIVVRPGGQAGQRPGRALPSGNRRLSQKTVAHLLEMSEVIEDAELSGALRRLARRHVANKRGTEAGADGQAGLSTGP